MKRILAFILCAVLFLCTMTACQGSEDPTEAPTNNTTEAPTQTPTEEPTEAPTEEPTDSSTEEPTDAPTEKLTYYSTEEPTEAPTENPTESPSEEPTEAPTEEDTGVTFDANFSVEGSNAEKLVSAMNDAKLAAPDNGTGSVIYIGDADAELVNAAKANIDRENCYGDFTVVTDGTNLAIYANSEYAINKAIEYVIANLTEGGCISVPDNYVYTEKTETASITFGENTIKDMTVSCANGAYSDIAEGFAESLSVLTGYQISVADSSTNTIKLVATDATSSDISTTSYIVTYDGNNLTISAATKGSLAYAVDNFLAVLAEGKAFEAGYSQTFTYNTVTYAATDTKLFKYCGTWQATDEKNPDTMVSYWDAAYVEIDFTGNAITLVFSAPTSQLSYRVDDGEYVTISNVTGDYTIFAEGGGKHTVRVLCSDKSRHMYFAGVKIEENATLSRTPDKKYYIQFVGDSISDASNSFSHMSADIMGWDYSVIACEALSLVRDRGCWLFNNGFTNGGYAEGTMAWHFYKNFGVISVGMEDAFFKLGIPSKMTPGTEEFNDIAANYYTEKYDFNFATGNTPDIVFIFLCTNDLSSRSSGADAALFANTYKSFVEKIFEVYGKDTKICMMQALTTSSSDNLYDTTSMRFVAMDRAAKMLTRAYPDNVHYINANTVFSWGVDISSDGTHPSALGYQTLTEQIANYLPKVYK